MKTHLMLALLAAGALVLVSAAPASTAAGKQHVTITALAAGTARLEEGYS